MSFVRRTTCRASRGSALTRSTPPSTSRRWPTILTGARQQLKGLLRDQSVLAGVGNAYSDEVLHAAKLSPFRLGGSLSEAEVETLHTALIDVLTDALGRSRGLAAADLKAEKKLALRVHGRTGQAVPGLRGHRARGGLRGLLAAVLPDLPDGGQAARRPAAVPPAQVMVPLSHRPIRPARPAGIRHSRS